MYLIAIVYTFANRIIVYANEEHEVGNKLQMMQDAYPLHSGACN